MKKEFGKWLLDISKYMTTAILLSSVFSQMQSVWVYVVVILIIMLTLFIGLLLLKKETKGD